MVKEFSWYLMVFDVVFFYFEKLIEVMYIGLCMVYEGCMEWLELIELFEKCLYLMLCYCQCVVFLLFVVNYLFWIDDLDFDILVYVDEIEFEGLVMEEFFVCVVVEVYQGFFLCKCLLWSVMLVYGLFGDNMGVVWKVYYVMIDGVLGIDLMMVFNGFSLKDVDLLEFVGLWSLEFLLDLFLFMYEVVCECVVNYGCVFIDVVFESFCLEVVVKCFEMMCEVFGLILFKVL